MDGEIPPGVLARARALTSRGGGQDGVPSARFADRGLEGADRLARPTSFDFVFVFALVLVLVFVHPDEDEDEDEDQDEVQDEDEVGSLGLRLAERDGKHGLRMADADLTRDHRRTQLRAGLGATDARGRPVSPTRPAAGFACGASSRPEAMGRVS
jgi:hypothetical protein